MVNDNRRPGRWVVGAAALFAVLPAGCGDDGAPVDGGVDVDVGDVLDGADVDVDVADGEAFDPCAVVDCSRPPPASCVGEATLRTYAGAGRCVDGACVYDEFTDAPCTGCCYGAEINLTGEPLGGGSGYTEIFGPSDADVVVATAEELLAALGTAAAGEVIYVADGAEIDLGGRERLELPGGVTLAGGRGRDGVVGGLVYCDTFAYPLFVTGGEGVRLTGLRLRGPNPEIGDHDYELVVHSGAISNRFRGFEVDNCELWAWGTSAVSLGEGADDAWVHHNHIHHTRRAGLGYGVVLDRAAAVIEGNVFDFCRHHIAATGRPGTSYEARYNLVLEHANGHGFDMHGAPDFDKYDTKALWRLDEGEGTAAEDSSVSGYHPANDCVLVGMDAASCWVSGVVNTGLELDGVDDRLECSTDASLTAAEGSFTLWVRPAAAGAAGLLDLFSASGDGCVVGLDGSGRVEVDVTRGGSLEVDLASVEVVAAGEWHHIVVTQDGSAVAVYIDGVVVSTTGTNGGAWTAGLVLAGVWVGDGPGGNFAGAVDEVRVYDRALTAEEVARHAAGNPDIAGNRIVMHHNTFRDIEQSAIVIRGVPAEGAVVHHNWFHLADAERAIRQVYAVGNLVVEDNHFGDEVPPGTVLPVVGAEVGPGVGRVPLAVRGDARASYDPLGGLDGWFWDFGDGSRGEGSTIEHVYGAAGRYVCRSTVRDERGALVSGLVPVVVSPEPAGYGLDFWVKDSYVGPLVGFYEKRALVDGVEVWSDDVAGDEGWQHVAVELDAAAAGRERLDVTLRVQNLAAVDGELIELDVFWDDVKLFGGVADGDDFEDGSGWTFARSGAPFSGRPSSMEPHAGDWAYRINSPYATACPAGAWGEIGLAVPLLPRSLLGRWRFDDGGGAVAEDSSLYGVHGVLVGMDAAAAWVSGIVGGGLAFDGVDDEVVLGPAGGLATATGTLLLWLRGDGGGGSEQTVFEVRDVDGGNSFLLGRTGDGRLLVRGVRDGVGVVELSSAVVVSDAAFHHVALTQDGSGVRLYVDGEAAATAGTDGGLLTGHIVPARVTFGAGGAGRLAGVLDEVRLWSEVLDAGAIAEDHRRGRVLAAWGLDDGAGVTARDDSGGGHDGALVGFAGDAAWVAGRVGGALDFDGTDDRVECAASETLATTEGTLELWFEADTVDDDRDLANIFEDGWENFLLLRRTAAGRILLLIEDDDVAVASVSTSASVGSGWHHVAVTQDGTGVAIFVDGRAQPASGTNSGAWTGGLALTGVWFGGGHWSRFDGRLDEVRLWARALTPAEIAEHAGVP